MQRCASVRMIAPAWSGCCTAADARLFTLERLQLLDAERVIYRLPKPQRDGTTALTLTPLELIGHSPDCLHHCTNGRGFGCSGNIHQGP